jgi:RHS repeat-associated protein
MALRFALRGIHGGRGPGRGRARQRRARRRVVRLVATALAPVLTAGTLQAAAVVAGGAVAATVVSAAVSPAPAKAATTCSGSVLVFPDSVNGGSSSAEAAEASALGCSVTMFASSDVSGMTQAQMETWFGGFTAIIIGDPSTSSSCSTAIPADASQYAADWGPAVKANVVVLGTAPVLAGSAGKTLLDDAISYAVTGGAAQNTGLYVSLNCDYSTAPAGSAVALLASVGGGGFTVTGQSSNCPDIGTPDQLQTATDGAFNGLTAGNLGSWPSPACSVQETLTAFPAGLSGLAYDGAATPATFTASDGKTGQAYILAGTLPSTGTLALAPSQGGEVPAGTTTGGGNSAAPQVSQPTAGDPVNTENGDFTQSDTDFTIPTFGPSLDFTRSYDALAAQQQEQTGSPGAMGYGWSDNWASSMTPGRPVEGDIYTLDGLRTANADGHAATSAPLNSPAAVYVNGNTYIADTAGNRVEEIPGTSGTQWGISMTAGDVYTIAGSPAGTVGESGNGTLNTSSLLDQPAGVWLAGSDLFIADSGNNRVLILAGSTSPWGAGMAGGDIPATATPDDLYVVAGTGTAGTGSDGKAAIQSALNDPVGVFTGGNASTAVYIADAGNNRVQMLNDTAWTHWGQSNMTAGDVYTLAGSAAGTAGSSGDGGTASSALLDSPRGATIDSSGNFYIADTLNNRIQEIPAATGAQWGDGTLTANDIYTIAGSASGTAGTSGDGGAAKSGLLDNPKDVTWGGPALPNLYIADSLNNRVQEVSGSAHTEFGQSMAANDIYTVAGSATGAAGFSGDGGTGTAALLNDPASAMETSGNLYLADTSNNRIREVAASTDDIATVAGDGETLASNGDGGPATQAALNDPMQEAFDSHGDTYIADAGNNRIQEIASYNHTQYTINMTAGDVYTIAGQADGQSGCQCDGHLATQAYLNDPTGIAIDGAGNLYISDYGNNRIQEVPNATGTQWGQSMTDGYMYTVAGNQFGQSGTSGDGGPASAALLARPMGLALDSAGDIYIADYWNSRVQEIAAVSGTQWGQSMTAGDIYTVTGSPTGVHGQSGDGGPAGSALLYGASGVQVDAHGDLYIADDENNRIQEIAAAGGTQWGQNMTAGDIYTVAGSAGGGSGKTGDGGPATAALLTGPQTIAIDPSGDIYIADDLDNRIQEVAANSGTQWGQLMTAGDMYTVAGSAAGQSGNSGDGGPATGNTGALMANAQSISLDPEGDLYITDNANDTVREVASAIPAAIPPAPGQTSSLAIAQSGAPPGTPGGLTVTQPGGAQVTFWAKTNGSCPSQYVATGSYCILPQDQGATLSYTSGNYVFSADPGDTSYTYNSSWQLTSEADSAGDSLTVSYNSPSPGASTTGTSTAVTCPSTAASCETIISASKRALVLGWNGANATGQVTSVTDPMNRTWTYGYNGSGQLTSATDPMSNKTTYTYGPGSSGSPLLASDLLTITSPDAQPGYSGPDADPGADTVNVYDSQGRVTRQTDPMGWTTTFNYCVSAAAGNCMNTATGTGFVTVTDPDGNTTVYDYEQGTLADQTVTTGSAITSQQVTVPDTTAGGTSGGSLQDTASVDGDGNTTTSAYNADGNPTTSTSPGSNGTPATTTTAYTATLQQDNCDATAEASPTGTCGDGASPPTPVAPGGVIAPPSSPPPSGVTYTLYDTDGNQLYSTTGVYSPAGSYEYSQTTYQLFKGNSVTLNSTNITCTNTPPSASLPCAQIDPDGVVTQLEYNPQGDLIQSSAPDGNSGNQQATAIYTYDGDGEQQTQVAPDGNLSGANAGNYTTTTAYNSDGEPTSVTDGNGTGYTDTPRVTSYGYDGDGNTATVIDARGYTTATTFNADDKPVLVTNPDQDATLTCYDGDGNTAETVPPAGVAANSLTPASCPTSYPADYNPQTKTPLASDATMYTYDAAGDKTAEYDPAPAGQSGYETTTYTYDGNGNVLTTTAPSTSSGGAANVTTDTYNSAGKITTETSGSGSSAASTVSYCYDPNGDATSVVYADGNTSGTAACGASSPWTVTASPQAGYQTTYSYDSMGDAVSSTAPATAAAPSGATWTATYDAAGNKLTSVDPAGVTTTFTYTPAGNTASMSYSGGAAHSVTYSYDANGNLTGMSDATGTSSYSYDPFDELTSAQNGAGQVTGFGYDADGDTSSITYPLPATATWATTPTVSYGYDHAGQLNTVTDFNGHQLAIGNTADGLPDSVALGSSGDTVTTSYDNTDAPSVITLKNATSTLQSFAYSDAPAGTILSETDTPSSSSATYTYDAKGQVTSMTEGTGGPSSYGFDASGNLTTLPGGAAGYYDHAGELTSATHAGTTTSYAYNADGQRLTATQGTTTLASGTWNGAAQLTAYTDSAAAMTGAAYTGTGLRSTATFTPAGGQPVTQNFVWDTTSQVPGLLMDSANAYIYGSGAAPAEQVNLATGAITYLVADSLGSVRGTVSASGSLTGTTSYDAWGNPESAGGLTSATPFGYAGGYTDPSGLLYLINRYYDPASGQFTSLDPLVNQSLEPYAYAGSNPVTGTDPSGLWQPMMTGGGGCSGDPQQCPTGSNSGSHTQPTNPGPGSWSCQRAGMGCSPVRLPSAVKAIAEVIGVTAAYAFAAEVAAMLGRGATATSIGGTKMLGRMFARFFKREAESGGAWAVRQGQIGEDAVRSMDDIGDKEAVDINGRKRIFDGLNLKYVSEVKNVKYQALTRQLKDILEWAGKNNRKMVLYTRHDTYITKPLQELIDQKEIIHKYIPGM